MRIYLCSILALFINVSVVAEQLDTPAIKSSLAVKSLLLDIENVNDKYLITVGERGHILRSETATDWLQVDVPTQSTLTAVYFVNDQLGWAVGHNSVILHTADGGLSWVIQQYLPDMQKPLLDVVFKNENDGIALGAYGLFFRTNNGGQTWQQEFHISLLSDDDLDYLDELKQEDEEAYLEERANILPHFNRIKLLNNKTYLVGELGLIGESDDFGLSWNRLEDIYQGSFFDLVETSSNGLIALGLRGNVFKSYNSGKSWSKNKELVTTLLNSAIVSDKNIYIFGNSGVLLESHDEGQTFVNRKQKDGKALMSGAIFNNQLVMATETGIKRVKVTN